MRAALAVLILASILLPIKGISGFPSSAIAQAGGQSLSLDDYWKQVEQTRQVVSSLQAAPVNEARQGLDQLALEWEAITRVELPDGTILPIDSSEMVSLLRQDPPALATVLARLDALQTARARFPTNKFSQKDLDSLARILSGSQFQWAPAASSQSPDWWNKFRKNFLEWLSRLLNGLGLKLSLPGGATLLTWVLVILLAGVLVYVGRGLLTGLVRDEKISVDGADGQENLNSETALLRAQTLSDEGNYRSAVRYLYLSALLLLDERGLLRYDRSRTNREYLHTFAGTAELIKPLGAVIDIFDRVWYGYEPINQSTYEDYVRHVGELKKYKP